MFEMDLWQQLPVTKTYSTLTVSPPGRHPAGQTGINLKRKKLITWSIYCQLHFMYFDTQHFFKNIADYTRIDYDKYRILFDHNNNFAKTLQFLSVEDSRPVVKSLCCYIYSISYIIIIHWTLPVFWLAKSVQWIF